MPSPTSYKQNKCVHLLTSSGYYFLCLGGDKGTAWGIICLLRLVKWFDWSGLPNRILALLLVLQLTNLFYFAFSSISQLYFEAKGPCSAIFRHVLGIGANDAETTFVTDLVTVFRENRREWTFCRRFWGRLASWCFVQAWSNQSGLDWKEGDAVIRISVSVYSLDTLVSSLWITKSRMMHAKILEVFEMNFFYWEDKSPKYYLRLSEGRADMSLCINVKSLSLIQFIISLCFLAIISSLFSFMLDVLAPKKHDVLKALKRYAFGYIFSGNLYSFSSSPVLGAIFTKTFLSFQF